VSISLGSASKLGWGFAVVVLLVLLMVALHRWWAELGEMEKLSSNLNPRWRQFKDKKRPE